MRLKFLASTLVRGGAENMAAALSRGLMRRGHEVEWILLREPGTVGEELSRDMPLQAGAAPGKADWLNVPGMVRRLRGAGALYVLDHDNAAAAASLAAPAAGIPIRFLAVHTTGRWGGGRSLSRVMRLALPSYTAVLALSPAHRDYLIQEEGVKADSIRLLPNGIDLTRFQDLPDGAVVRRELGLAPEARVVGSVAMLRPEKNHELLLEAARDLEARIPELHIVLVGGGQEREPLERRAQALGLRGRIHFLGRRDDAARVMRAFDVLALTSHPLVETQPLAVLEAMAAGIPVVASRVGDLPEMLREESGILVEPGDREGFTRELGRVLEDTDLGRALAERGRRRVGAYSLEASLDRFEALVAESAS